MKNTFRDTLRMLGKVLRYLRGDRLRFLTGLLLSAWDSMLFNAMFGFLLIVAFSGIESGAAPAYGAIWLILGCGVVLLSLSIVLGGWLYRTAGIRSVARLRQGLMDRALTLPASWFGSRHSGDVLSRMTADMQAAEQALGWNLQFPVRALIAGVGGAVLMFVTDWRFALAAIALGLISIWATTRFAAPMKRISDAVQAAAGLISERASDLMAAAQVLRIFNLGQWASDRMSEAAGDACRSAMRRTRLQTGQDAVNTVTGWCMFIGLLVFGSLAVILGFTSFTKMVGLVQFNGGLFFMFQAIGGAYTQLQASLAGAERVFELLDAEREQADDGQAVKPLTSEPAIRLDGVSFAYEDGRDVLTGLSHTVQPGETVALVGSSGGGKSTVLKLLLGFYPAASGDISLFGHGMAANRTDLRRLIAYVPQTCYLFSGTVRDNIAAGRPGATTQEVEEAARAALAHDFILELPQGYDTEVGERGAQLSGGQRQRIAIARAILKDAPLLLLDEATASLDSQSESQVQQALEALMQGRTVIVVAHRLSTVRNANRILVLEGGSIVEQGAHEELLRSDGRYATYYRAQFEGSEDVPA